MAQIVKSLELVGIRRGEYGTRFYFAKTNTTANATHCKPTNTNRENPERKQRQLMENENRWKMPGNSQNVRPFVLVERALFFPHSFCHTSSHHSPYTIH